jgi:hypothetical protein
MATASLHPLPKLPDIHQIEPVGSQDQACMDEIREVLKRHGALQRFGLTLLHQHFDMSDEEVLIESVDTENRILTMQPSTADPVGRAIETSWRLDDPTGVRRCEVQCVPDRDAEGNDIHSRPHYMTS